MWFHKSLIFHELYQLLAAGKAKSARDIQPLSRVRRYGGWGLPEGSEMARNKACNGLNGRVEKERM
jgi:hypothetical protein